MPFTVGENAGPYRIIEQLGQGGMATVFKAYHASLDRYVAIKALHPAFNQDPNFEARFQREARVVAKLEHPNIVPIYDYAEHEKRPYLVMKFIEGETLKARLDRGPLSSGEVSKIVDAVGSALAYAHKQGVLHRDIKPSNVLVSKDGQIYLADFGLARIAQSGESTLSSDMIMGTPQYISPEQAMGTKDLDERTDLYSFGVMLYEMVVGRVPFNADTPFSVIHDHIYSPMPLPHSVNPNVPESVERVLLKALSKEREGRYENAMLMTAAFKDAWTEAGKPMPGASIEMPPPAEPALKTAVRAEPPVQAAPKSEPTKASARAETAAVSQRSEKKRSTPAWLWVSAGLVILLCIGFFAFARNTRLPGRLLANRQNPPSAQTIPAPAKILTPVPFGVSASITAPNSKPFAVMDGDIDTIWNSGADPVQWIQIDLGRITSVSAIRLVVSQFPEGETVHQIWVGSKTLNPTLLHEFKGVTRDRDTLEFKPNAPLGDIRIVRIVTVKSPSWVAWREINIIIP